MATRYPNAPEGVDPVEWEINLLCDRLILRVNERRVSLLATAREKRQDMRERHTLRDQSEQQLLATKAEIERLMKENLLRDTQERLLAEVEQKLLEVRVFLPQTRLVFKSQSGLLEELVAGLGEVLEEHVPIVPRYKDMRAVVAVGKRGRAPGELCYPNGIAIETNSNQIYVTEGGTLPDSLARISIWSEGGEYLNSFTHQELRLPYGIAIHGECVYVSDVGARAVFLFRIGNSIELVTKIGTRGSGIGQFNTPYNLAISNNGDVYVADYSNNRISILDSSLHYIRTLTQEHINRPRDVKLTDNTVYVLCHMSPCILVFSYGGELIRSVITRGIQINYFYYFCIDAAENIIISDSGFHSIKIFSKEGTHIHTIREMFEYPRGLALTKELSLVVVYDSENYALRIFSCL